jgi:hypothetical protein
MDVIMKQSGGNTPTVQLVMQCRCNYSSKAVTCKNGYTENFSVEIIARNDLEYRVTLC